MYQVPVNPNEVDWFEPGLLDEFVAHVAARTAAEGVPFIDYRKAAHPSWFVVSRRGTPDGIHLSKNGHAHFARFLSLDVANRLSELGR